MLAQHANEETALPMRWTLPFLLMAGMAWGAPPDVGTELPKSLEGLPGQGPVRTADWFRDHWRERRQLFQRNLSQEKGAVVFFGDSITEGWGGMLATSFPGISTANRGISGDTSRGLLLRLVEDVVAVKPRAVVLLIGTNDHSLGSTPQEIGANLRQILLCLSQERPHMPIIWCEVLPSSATQDRPAEKIRALNNSFREVAGEFPTVTLVDTWSLFADEKGDASAEEFPDLLHPNEFGYRRLAQFLEPIVRAALPEE